MEVTISYIKQLLIQYGPKLGLALVTAVVGFWAIERVTSFINTLLKKSKVAGSLRPFVTGVTNIALKAFLIIHVLNLLGVQTTSFIALLGSAGLAIGMALSGTVKNLAGGLMLLHFKPFKVGDLVQIQGHTGRVLEIQIFNTIIKTPDNKIVTLPNGPVSDGTTVNYYAQPTRRVELHISVDYENDLSKVKQVLHDVIDADNRIHEEPKKLIAVYELGDTHVIMRIRVWTDSKDYWSVYYDLNEQIKNSFDKNNISCHVCPLSYGKK